MVSDDSFVLSSKEVINYLFDFSIVRSDSFVSVDDLSTQVKALYIGSNSTPCRTPLEYNAFTYDDRSSTLTNESERTIEKSKR